jgi:uncharacterized protein (TIGR02246 family)
MKALLTAATVAALLTGCASTTQRMESPPPAPGGPLDPPARITTPMSPAPGEMTPVATEAQLAAVRRDMDNVRRQWVEAYQAHDVAALRRFYAPDATLWFPGQQPLRGWAALEPAYRAGFEATRPMNVQLTPAGTRLRGDVYYEWGTFSQMVHPADRPAATERGRYLAVFERQPDGNWLLTARVTSPETM